MAPDSQRDCEHDRVFATIAVGVVAATGPDLREAEPMAWDFVMHFARDNDLQVAEGSLDAK